MGGGRRWAGWGSMAAWLLAQGSISPGFGFPKQKPNCTWGLWWYSRHQTGVGEAPLPLPTYSSSHILLTYSQDSISSRFLQK